MEYLNTAKRVKPFGSQVMDVAKCPPEPSQVHVFYHDRTGAAESP